MLYASVPKWKNWPDDLKKVLEEGCKMASDYNNQLLSDYEKVAFKRLEEKGMTVLDVDHQAFEAVGKRVWEKFDGQLWDKGFMDKVQATLEQIRKSK